MTTEELEMEKVAMAPEGTTFDVRIDKKLTFDKDLYLLFRIARTAYESQRAALGIPDMDFEEYVMRSYVASIGGKIIADLENRRSSHM